MFHSKVLQRPQDEEEDRLRREKMTGSSQQHPPYTSHSPTHPHFNPPFSPTNGSHQRHFSNQYHPPTPAPLPIQAGSQNTHSGPPRSPTSNGLPPLKGSGYPPRDKPKSTYYDPTSDQGDVNSSWNYSKFPRESPTQSQQVSSTAPDSFMCRKISTPYHKHEQPPKMSRPLTFRCAEPRALHLPGIHHGTKLLH
jgi:hypothetical protein